MTYDCIVVGGGHNGLVCAAYLARAGRKVLVLESAATVGGAAVTREFSPGYRVSAAAHLLHLLSRRLVDDLELPRHGFELAARRLPTTVLGDGAALELPAGSGDQSRDTSGAARAGTSGDTSSDGSQASVGLSRADAAAYADHLAQLRRFARALRPLLEATPPRLGSGRWTDHWALLRMGLRVRALGRGDLRELLRIGAMNVYDLLEERFEGELLKGALAFDAVLGTNLGPRSPGSVLPLLYRLAAEAGADDDGLCQPRGGLGAVTEAIARAARAAGAEVRTGAVVRRVLITDDHVNGVELESGELCTARIVASNADPKTTLLGLLGPEHLDAGFVRRITHLRTNGLAAKLHLALDGLPRFAGVAGRALAGRLLVAPSMNYLERAFNSSKYGEVSVRPSLEITIPTLNDPALAPPGGHVLSAIVQYAPHTPRAGWEHARAPFLEATLAAIEAHAPGLRSHIRAHELLTPYDIEQQFRIRGGHWHHGALSFDQFFMVRPVPGAAQYRTPMPGLFLCGAGAHPGGGVTGLAGRNCARAILAGARAA